VDSHPTVFHLQVLRASAREAQVLTVCVKDCGLHNQKNIDLIILFACLVGLPFFFPCRNKIKIRHNLSKKLLGLLGLLGLA